MSEQDINNNNAAPFEEEMEIQSSAYVSSQVLHSNSVSSSRDFTGGVTSKSFNTSRHSSKTRLSGENEESETAHYSGAMERFFQSEVRAVHFGGKDDAFLLLKVTVVAGLLVNLFGVLVYMQYDDLIPHDPNDHHPHGLLHLLSAFESALSAYYSDGQIVVGWMLSCWFLGYNVISAMIWWQFERRESRLPDDYEIIPSNRMRRRAVSSNADLMDGTGTPQPFRKVNNKHKNNNNASGNDEGLEPRNPFDKSVVIISMPNGDFSVGKRQKVLFN